MFWKNASLHWETISVQWSYEQHPAGNIETDFRQIGLIDFTAQPDDTGNSEALSTTATTRRSSSLPSSCLHRASRTAPSVPISAKDSATRSEPESPVPSKFL